VEDGNAEQYRRLCSVRTGEPVFATIQCSVRTGEPVFATVQCTVRTGEPLYVQASLSLRRHSTPGIIPLAGEARPNERAERFKQCETANDQFSVNQADNILKALRPEMARSNHNSSMTVSMFVCCG